MYADDDPDLGDVRRVCVALPEAVEIEAWGRPTFWSPAYHGPGGRLALDLTTGKPDWDEVAELVTGSYRQVALKRQLKALEEA
jgi:hypothetical protein